MKNCMLLTLLMLSAMPLHGMNRQALGNPKRTKGISKAINARKETGREHKEWKQKTHRAAMSVNTSDAFGKIFNKLARNDQKELAAFGMHNVKTIYKQTLADEKYRAILRQRATQTRHTKISWQEAWDHELNHSSLNGKQVLLCTLAALTVYGGAITFASYLSKKQFSDTIN